VLTLRERLWRARATVLQAALASRDVSHDFLESRRETARHSPRPPRTGTVLEVGGGQAPNPRADVVVDKYVADNTERDGPLDLAKPLIVADGHALPFADQSVAYTIASHVLEHATDPVAFARELGRVSPAGFVQTPTRQAELAFGWSFHPWLIDRDGDGLVFEPKGSLRAWSGHLLHQGYAESEPFRLWFGAHRSRWHHSVEWRDELHVRVAGESQADETADVDVERTLALLGELQARGGLRPLTPSLRQALRCPACHGELALRDQRASCRSCERSYPVKGDVPVLLEEALDLP
jgi:uncharacterized protein YbaR (Trm112 family)